MIFRIAKILYNRQSAKMQGGFLIHPSPDLQTSFSGGYFTLLTPRSPSGDPAITGPSPCHCMENALIWERFNSSP